MKRMLVTALALAFPLLAGCSYISPGGHAFSLGGSLVHTGFLDVTDAETYTDYKSTLALAPVSKLDGKQANMSFGWTPERGQIAVGESVTGLDQTAQGPVINGIVETAVRAAVQAALKQPPLIPAIPDPVIREELSP